MRDIAVAAHHLTKTYGSGEARVIALDDVSVELETGRLTAVTGASGSGKSTLLHVLAGLDSVEQGEVLIGNTTITGMRDKALTTLRRDRIGFVFQSFNLLPMLTAEQNILLPLDLAGRRPDRDRFDSLIETFGLGARLDHLPAQLSGGQQQRVAIARALGAAVLLGPVGTVVVGIPWAILVAVVVAGALAGALAASIPARRALRVQPVEALAEVA